MTRPIYEPTPSRTDAVLGFGSDQLFRRPTVIPSETRNPYPPLYPKVAITSCVAEHRFWPAGMIVVPAYAWNVDGTVITGSSDSAFANNGVRHDQSAANFAAAATTVEFTPEDIGLPTGDGAPWYSVVVGMRMNDTGTNIGVRMSPKGEDPNTSDSGYGQVVYSPGVVKSYYGLFRLTYTKSPGFPITGYIHKFQPGETITIKAYRTGGSGSVDLDNIYFFPSLASDSDAGIDLAEQVMHVLAPALYSTLSATAQYSGFGGTPSEPYCELGGGDEIQDTQIRRGWRDPALEWSGACGMTEGFSEWAMAFQQLDYHLAIHPRHVYAAARLRGTGDAFYGQTDTGGFVALGHDSLPVGQAHVYSDHWGLYYLGCHAHMVTAQGDIQMGYWMPDQDNDFPTGFPVCSTGNNADFEAMVGGDVMFISSIYDWVHWKNGGQAYFPDPSP